MALSIEALFQEEEYLAMYPDIAEAVRSGRISRPIDHFLCHGRAEGRLAFRFDEAWYARSYPLAVSEVAQGQASSLRAHYENFGAARGYLPHLAAIRRDNPSAVPSRFGGLWVDQVNARDIVAGRLEIGFINSMQADLLLFFIENGYVVIKSAVPDTLTGRALIDLDRAYRGEVDGMLYECRSVTPHRAPWQAEFFTQPTKALDLHYFSEAVRDLIFSDAIVSFLGLLFDSKPFASQTLSFYRGSAQEGHQDSAYVPYGLQRGFAASWIALEDVAVNTGELFYFRGSHRLEDFFYADRYKNVSEALRCGAPSEEIKAQMNQHTANLGPRAIAAGMDRETFLAKRGDVLIWHADLVHGGGPISAERTRRSVVTHYCSKFTSPLFAEQQSVPFYDHLGRGFYTTSCYPALTPR